MDSIKKKMIAMKMEKENAQDRAEQLEQQLRDTEEQKAKIEEDLTSLQKKHSNLENEFDTVNEKYQECQTKMEEAEKTASEVDMDLDTGLSQDSVVSMSSSQLSQDSVASSHSTDLTSDLLTPEVSGKKKKKSGTKKVKKKKDKGDGETGEKVKKSKKDKSKKSRSSSSVRPEPEGGNPVNLVPMDEFDRVIYNNDPLFSDIDISEEEDQSQKPQRPSRAPRPGGLMFSCLSLGIQSNTMIKYAIIGTEVQNILKVSLRRSLSVFAFRLLIAHHTMCCAEGFLVLRQIQRRILPVTKNRPG
uniref:Tropomyosin n=1 Tax=Magallana gigas TaxID=29159 RepID=K1QFV5_MAGGI